jgi:hypothetical protein
VNAIIQFVENDQCPASIKPKMYSGPTPCTSGSHEQQAPHQSNPQSTFPKASAAVNNSIRVEIHTRHVLPCRMQEKTSYRKSHMLAALD